MAKKAWKVKVVERAIELLEKGWTKDARATDSDGRICSITDSYAARFNLPGALERALRDCSVQPGLHSEFLRTFSSLVDGTSAANQKAESAEEVIAICNSVKDKLQKSTEDDEAKQKKKQKEPE